MSLGRILLLAVSVLVLFGVGQRVLDKLRLTDRQALFFMALIFFGGLVPSLPKDAAVRVNLGGALVPAALDVYLFVRAGTSRERLRAAAAAVLTGLAVLLLGWFLPDEPETMPFDVNYLYGPVAGVFAYAFGRSRIGAFIAGTLGVLLADTAQGVINAVRGLPLNLNLGGAGALDAVVLSGLTAVLLGEVFGTILERLSGREKRRAALVHGQQTLLRSEEQKRGKGE